MKKPDRFARVVGRAQGNAPASYALSRGKVLKLLRAEHLAVVRLVKRELAYRTERNRDPNEVTDVSGVSACKALLAALARRAR